MRSYHIRKKTLEKCLSFIKSNRVRKRVEVVMGDSELKMREWVCRDCGHMVLTQNPEGPSPMRWNDGHTCDFEKKEEE